MKKKESNKGAIKQGLSMKKPIPKDYKPRGEGQGQRPTEKK